MFSRTTLAFVLALLVALPATAQDLKKGFAALELKDYRGGYKTGLSKNFEEIRKARARRRHGELFKRYPDHCAPHNSLKQRIRLLGKYGTVHETVPGRVFKAGKHGMRYSFIPRSTFRGQPSRCF